MDPARVQILTNEIERAREALGEAVSDNDYIEAALQQYKIEVLEDLLERLV